MSDNTSKYTMICFPCRYTTKATWMSRRCPHCEGSLENAGKHFNVPKKSDDKAWKASEEWQRQRTATWEHRLTDASFALARKWAARRHQPHWRS